MWNNLLGKSYAEKINIYYSRVTAPLSNIFIPVRIMLSIDIMIIIVLLLYI
jgi:hypothetical protein